MDIKSVISKIEKQYNISKEGTGQADLNYIKDIIDIENNDKKDDAQRRMTWAAITGMLIYPILVIVADACGLPHASDLISGMSAVYFASVSAIIMVFFGANAYVRSRNNPKDKLDNPPNTEEKD